MAGVKERSGGARPGAGRPCKSIEIKPGDEFWARTITPDGMLRPVTWTVESVSRTEIVIKTADGDTIKLMR